MEAGRSGRILCRLALALSLFLAPQVAVLSAAPLNPDPPASPVKLIFIHHSTGQNWLADDNGGLGAALRDNNYYVSDTNYGWGPFSTGLGGPAGDFTDIGHWWSWFAGPDSGMITAALYGEYGQHSAYERMEADPGGENGIVMFKSCFPNSALMGEPDDGPPAGDNPLRGRDSGSEFHTVGNAKGIYLDLLAYFAARPDKLFIVIAAPPLRSPAQAANARAFNTWLVNDWLKGYPHRNVAVFDFYNVLTSNGGSANISDLGRETGNHHRWWGGMVQHKADDGADTLRYPSGDDHPNRVGSLKATGEYVALLNIFYHCWKGTGGCPDDATRVLTVAKEGAGTGTVTSDPPGIACGSRCSGVFADRSTVALLAAPEPGSLFAGWSGGGCSGTGACTVNLDADRAVTAVFSPAPCVYTLSPAARAFPARGGAATIHGAAAGPAVCGPPEVTHSLDWITIEPVGVWARNRGSFRVAAKPNGLSSPRSGAVAIGGAGLAVSQVGTVCSIAKIVPPSQTIAKAGGTSSFGVAVSASDCAWTASAGVSWITVDPHGGLGNGAVPFIVTEPNPRTTNRTGGITVTLLPGGRKGLHRVIQLGR